MRKLTAFTALFTVAAAFAASAHAQTAKPAPAATSGGYFQVGASSVKVDSDTFSAVHLGTGFDAGKHVAFEIGGDVGLNGKTYTYNGNSFKLRFDYDFGAYVVGKLPVSPNADLLGRVGYVRVQESGASNGNKVAVGDRGLAYGVGIRYFINGGNNGVRADVTHFDFGGNRSSGDLIQLAFIRRY